LRDNSINKDRHRIWKSVAGDEAKGDAPIRAFAGGSKIGAIGTEPLEKTGASERGTLEKTGASEIGTLEEIGTDSGEALGSRAGTVG
jgi:hypothetical protein